MNLLPHEVIEDLKCAKCNNYLSYLPVYEHKLSEIAVCGRCLTVDHEDIDEYQRSSFYEKLAKYIKFPCQYQNEGCEELFYPSEIQNHEGTCIFKPFNCPLEEIKDCSWEGCYLKLLDHYKKCHKEFIIENNKVEIDFTQADFHAKYLLINSEACEEKSVDEVFIVDMQWLALRLRTVVFYFGLKHMGGHLNFTLVLNSNNFDFPEVVPLYSCCYSDRNKIVPGMISFKRDFAIGTFNISKVYSVVRHSSLKCFFCCKWGSLCCKKGHNLCENCTNLHSEKCSFTDLSDNEKLIQTVAKLKFSCSNSKKGCMFSCNGNEEELETHQRNCVFTGYVTCPECENRYPDYRDFLHHVKEDCLYITGENTVYQWKLDIDWPKWTYNTYDNYIFEAKCWTSEDYLNVSVRMLHQCEVSIKYNFEIQFMNPTTEAEIMKKRQPISGAWNERDVTASVVVHRERLENAINNNIIGFKIEILKK